MIWKTCQEFLYVCHFINVEECINQSFDSVYNKLEKIIYDLLNFQNILPRRWRSGLDRSHRMRKVGCSNPNRDRPKSLKQVVTAPLLNVRQKVGVSRVLEDNNYERLYRVTVIVSC